MKVSTWQGCYDDSWNGLIVPEAFSHPAKFAPGLIRRIYQHCLTQGYLRKGDTVGDPFGGIGGGGIMAAPMGLNWIGVELERKFVELAKQNLWKDVRDWFAMGYPLPSILQGDSRHFSEIIGQCEAVVTSPPFTEDQPCASQSRAKKDYYAFTRRDGTKCDHLMNSPGQIGNLRFRDLDAVITSPPYENLGGTRHDGDRQEYHQSRGYNGNRGICSGNHYGQSENQIGLDRGETYWTAMQQVYSECWKALKLSGVLVVVVKAYVKNKRRVPLPQQTLKMLIRLGFTPLERIKAMLVKEERHQGLFGEIRKCKERKSFFRRLAEKKGSPRIDWEEVLVLQKPLTASEEKR